MFYIMSLEQIVDSTRTDKNITQSFKDRKTKLLERATDIERQIDKNARNRC